MTDAQLKKTIISANGDSYEITVTYGEDAQIPADAELRVREITAQDEEYSRLYQEAIAKSGGIGIAEPAEGTVVTELPEGEESENTEVTGEGKTFEATEVDLTADAEASTEYARFFDIEIWAGNQKIEPKADVAVTIALADVPQDSSSDLRVIHFAADGVELMDEEHL